MIKVLEYDFEGPFLSTDEFKNSSGVYVILGGDNNVVVDVGESKNIKTRIEGHDRKWCWNRQDYPFLTFAAYYINNHMLRMVMEREIRKNYDPPCGER